MRSTCDLDSQPLRRIEGDLWGQQLDATERLEETWGEVQRYLVSRSSTGAGVGAIEAEELAVMPGLEEIFALGDIKAYAESGDWDVVVVDCAPTAETLRLLSLPDILAWYMDRVFPAGRSLTNLVRPVLSRLTNLPMAGDDVFVALRRFYDRLDGVKELLTERRTGERASRREPRADGHRRGAADGDLPRPVRLRRRRRGRQPAPAGRRHRPVVQGVEGDPRRAPRRHRGRLRAAAGPASRAGSRRAGRTGSAPRLRRGPLRRRRRIGRPAPRARR